MKSRRGWIQKKLCVEDDSKISYVRKSTLLRDDTGFRRPFGFLPKISYSCTPFISNHEDFIMMNKEQILKLEEELKQKIDLIHEFRALLTSIYNCPYSNVKQYHKNQIDNLLSRKFKK